MTEKEVYCSLKEIGCCKYCCVRYSSSAENGNYEDIKQYIEENILKECTSKDEEPIKKSKKNPCIVCLGILSGTFFDKILSEDKLLKLNAYKSDGFQIALNAPPNILLRDAAVKIFLQEKFTEHYKNNKLKFVNVSKAFNLAIKRDLEKKLCKKLDHQSGFQITFIVDADDCNKDMEPTKKLFSTQEIRKRKLKKSGDYSKNQLKSYLEVCDPLDYKKYFPVPPEIPNTYAVLNSVDVVYENVFLAGRYCKYSRKVGQTPWPFNDVNVKTSVQEIIYDGLLKAFGLDAKSLTFSSGGREDLDVRCLGRGRPFYIKIKDSFKNDFSYDELRNLETIVNASPYVSIFDMDICKNENKGIIKTAEEKKKKSYIALCILHNPGADIDNLVERINQLGNERMVVVQKTPIRVAHRRPILSRKKCIYQMTARKIPENIPGHDKLLEVQLVTHAGTYVKEFIHGDLGRTVPNLSQILNTEIDLFKLDVIGIHSEWPKVINSIQHKGIDENEIQLMADMDLSDDEDKLNTL